MNLNLGSALIMGLSLLGSSSVFAQQPSTPAPGQALRCYYLDTDPNYWNTLSTACGYDYVGPAGYHISQVNLSVPLIGTGRMVSVEALTGVQDNISVKITDQASGLQATTFHPLNQEFMFYIQPSDNDIRKSVAVHCEIVPLAKVQEGPDLPKFLEGKCAPRPAK